MANAVLHFEIPADDVERATTFYQKTFGWTIKAFPMPPGEEYYSVVTRKKNTPGIDGGLMKRKMPDQPFTNYINVPSIDDSLQAVHANGGTVVMPKREIGPNMGWIALFNDPENNMMGLHQAPPTPARPRASKKKTARKTAAKKTKGAAKGRKAKKAGRRR